MVTRTHPRGLTRQTARSQWTTSFNSGAISGLGVAQKLDMLSQFQTDQGINATALKGYRIDRIVGRVSCLSILDGSLQVGYGITVQDTALPVATLDPTLAGPDARLSWMHLDWYQFPHVAADPTPQLQTSQYDRRFNAGGRRNRRIIRNSNDQLLFVFGTGLGVRWLVNARIWLSQG